MTLGPRTTKLFLQMADHLDQSGSDEPMDDDALHDAATSTASSGMLALLAEVNADVNAPSVPGETRGQYAARLRDAAGGGTS